MRSFSCAFRGLPVLFSTQRNIRVHLCFPVLADVVHSGQHPQAGRVKDIAAGAVLITAIAAVGIGLMIFLPRLT